MVPRPADPFAKRIRYGHEGATRGDMSIDDERVKHPTTHTCHEVRQGAMGWQLDEWFFEVLDHTLDPNPKIFPTSFGDLTE